MSTTSIRNQIKRLLEDLPNSDVDSRPIVTIAPATWPEDAFDAYLEACAAGNRERKYDLIEQQTGQRPSDRPDEIVIITVQMDRDLVEAGVVV